MFLENKYQKWYYSIIERAKKENREKGRHEEHHIIPLCFFKKNKRNTKRGILDGDAEDSDNLVLLTYREHFICHWLLIKMVDKRFQTQMNAAFSGMIMKGKNRLISSWQYEILRKSLSDKMKNRIVSEETRKKMRENGKKRIGKLNPWFGKHHTEEYKLNASKRMTGENHPFYGMKRPGHSEKMKIKMKGRDFSPEHRNNISKSWQESRKRVKCEHCGSLTTKAMNKRWHGKNCKKAI